MKPKIICVVGPSGSGKTLMTKFVKDELGIPYLVSYTTRPMRQSEANGVDHWFVSYSSMPPEPDMLAYTSFGGHYYWTEVKDIPKDGAVLYVIDEYGLKILKERYSKQYDIVAVLVKRDENKLIQQVGKERVERDRKRETIDETEYDAVIENNGSLLSFYREAKQTIQLLTDY